MDIRDAKNRLLSEIKVNNPTPNGDVIKKIFDKLMAQLYSWEDEEGDVFDDKYDELNMGIYDALEDYNLGGQIIDNEFEQLTSIEQKELYKKLKELESKYVTDINEDVNDFTIGKTTQTSQGKTVVTDIDPETQSVTWSVNKNLTDEDIHRDLSKLISKLESNKKNYSDEKRLKSLLQKLKFIRNTFKRSM